MVKSKSFSKKLLAVFLAVIMALSCFTGALTAFGYSADTEYADDAIADQYNFLGWVELQDEQTLTALLDWADQLLRNNFGSTKGTFNAVVASIDYDLSSINGVLSTLNSARALLNNGTVKLVLGGDAKNICIGAPLVNFINDGDSTSKSCMTRENSTSKDIIRAVVNLIYTNSENYTKDSIDNDTVRQGGTVIQSFVNGGFSLGGTLNGVVSSALGGSLYDLIGGLLNMPSGFENNMANNIVAYLLKTGVADDIASDGVWNNLDTTNNNYRFTDDNGNRVSFEAWAENAVNYGVLYTLKGVDNEYIYNDENFSLDLDAAGYDQIYAAFKPIFVHTLLPLFGSISMNHGFVTEFTSLYYEWATKQDGFTAPTTQAEADAFFTSANVNAWITADWQAIADYLYTLDDGNDNKRFPDLAATTDAAGRIETYNTDATEVKQIMTDLFSALDEGRTEETIDATNLFNKVIYSPIAVALGCQTGVLNLDIKDCFMGNFATVFQNEYDVDALLPSNGTIASQIYGLAKAMLGYVFPGFTNWAAASATQDLSGIVTEFVNSALNLIKYVADGTSAAILADFYADGGTDLTESNIESALMPLIKALVGQIGMAKQIHDEKWDMAADVDGMLYVALEEYLKFVLPDNDYSCLYTLDANGHIVITMDELQYMARDAVAYVMQHQVPIMKADGTMWDVFESGGTANGALVDSSTTAFDILNYVVCYYANNTGIAQLLNLTNYVVNGTTGTAGYESAISLDNTLWENIDIIVETYFPVLNDLFTTSAFDSEALIMDTIVNGIVNINDTNTTIYGHNMQGVSAIFANIVYAFISSAPVTSTNLINLVYDFIGTIFNVVLGARDGSDGLGLVIPTNTGSQPFTDIIQNGTLSSGDFSPSSACTGYYSDGGIISTLVGRIAENSLSGVFYTKSSRTITDTVLPGVAYIITAVNNFVNFIPQLSEVEFSAPEAYFSTPGINSFDMSSGSLSGMTYLQIENTALGLNRAFFNYSNGELSDPNQLGRYFVKVTNVTTDNSGVTITSNSNVIAPGDIASFAVSGKPTQNITTDSDGNQSSLITATITYSVVNQDGTTLTDGNGNTVAGYDGLTTTAYLYVTDETDWFDATYASRSSGTDFTWASGTYTTTSNFGTSDRLKVDYPSQIMLDSGHPETFQYISLKVTNTASGGLFAKDASIGSTYMYPVSANYTGMTVTTYTNLGSNYSTGSTQLTGTSYAIMATNADGDMIDYANYDYKYPTAGWVSYDVCNNGATYNGEDSTDTRFHVVASADELKTASVTLSRTDSDGNTYTYTPSYYSQVRDKYGNMQFIVVDHNECLNVNASYGTPIPGIYVALNGTGATIKFSKGTDQKLPWLYASDSSAIQTGSYSFNVAFYANNTRVATNAIPVKIVNTGEVDGLNSAYNELRSYAANYTASDFGTKYIDEDGEQQTITWTPYDTLVQAVKDSVVRSSKPVSIAAATANFNYESTKETTLVTRTADNILGDPAYEQVTSADTSFPSALTKYTSSYDEFGNSTSNTYYYADPDFVVPYYSNTPVSVASYNANYVYAYTDPDTNNQVIVDSAADFAEIPSGVDDLTAYVKNTTQYEYEWTDTDLSDSSAMPYYAKTATETGKYNKVQFVYRTATGDKTTSKVTSGDRAWAYKLAEQQKTIVDGAANRGYYEEQKDKDNYILEMLPKLVLSGGADLIVESVIEDRANLHEEDFNMLTYALMTKAAKAAEKLVSSSYDSEFVTVDVNSRDFSVTGRYDFYLASDMNDGTPVDGAESLDYCTYAIFLTRLAAGEYNAKGLPSTATTDDYVLGYWDPIKDDDDNIIYTYSTTASLTTINEAIRTYEFYRDKVVHRGYEDTDLATMLEILCATGDSYDYTTDYSQANLKSHILAKFSATPAVYTDGELTTAATITFNDTTMTPKYGALTNGVLTNTEYTEDSWNWYTEWLANCIIDVASSASDPGYSEGYYDSDADYQVQVSDLETDRTTLMKAENTLTIAEATGHTVSAYVGYLASKTATAGTLGNTSKGRQLSGVTISIEVNGETVTATTDDNGQFVFENVPDGTYTATVTYAYALTRTFIIVVNGADVESDTVIGILNCNAYNNGGKDTNINSRDSSAIKAQNGKTKARNAAIYAQYYYLDVNGDGNINSRDSGIAKAFSGTSARNWSGNKPAQTIQ